MSGIAEILLRSGYRVSGSDLRENAETARLKTLGAAVALGHRAENVGDAEILVLSSAVRRTTPRSSRRNGRGSRFSPARRCSPN